MRTYKAVQEKVFKKAYMSQEESDLYLEVRYSNNEKDQIIRKLLEDKASSSRAAHCGSRY